MALEHQLNIVSLVSAVNKAALRLWTLICIIRRQDEKKIPSKLFFKTASFPQRYIHLNSYTKWLAFYTSLTSHESKSSLESAVHESKSSLESLFMRLKCDSSPSQVSSLYLCDLSATRVQVADSSFHLWVTQYPISKHRMHFVYLSFWMISSLGCFTEICDREKGNKIKSSAFCDGAFYC